MVYTGFIGFVGFTGLGFVGFMGFMGFMGSLLFFLVARMQIKGFTGFVYFRHSVIPLKRGTQKNKTEPSPPAPPELSRAPTTRAIAPRSAQKELAPHIGCCLGCSP